jgi:type VI secretion system protein ImpC
MARALVDVQIDIDAGTKAQTALEPDGESPFRIVLLGDFGGRACRNEPRLRRDPILVAPDNFEQVMERLGTGLRLTAGGVPISLQIRELEHFHPDHLYRTLPIFQSLRQARAELCNPATFRATAAGFQEDQPSASAPPDAFTGSLLDQIVERTAAPERPPLDRGAPLDEAIRRIIAPHIIPKPDVHQAELVAQVDAATAALMRAILSHPDFQALEATWRSAFFLLQRLRTSTRLKLYVIDVTRDEMVEATLSGHPQLIAREGWSAAACLHSFHPSEADCKVLESLAGLARKSGGPLLAGMHSRLVGCESLAASPDPDDWNQPLEAPDLHAWQQLRSHPDACWLGLAVPRILLRLPYGEATSEAETFDFEEMPQPPDHEAYLWGSPAVACVCLMGQSFLLARTRNQLDGMPIHHYRVDGEAHMTPAAETWLTDRAADKVLEQGVMPLASSKNTDSVLLVRSQSIAHPARPLAGQG